MVIAMMTMCSNSNPISGGNPPDIPLAMSGAMSDEAKITLTNVAAAIPYRHIVIASA